MTTTAVPCRVLLLGMMGSGKSTVGRLLSERLGWPYHDNDALLEAATGRTARQLLRDGLAALRHGEAEAMRQALAVSPPCIAGIAAGVVLDRPSRDLLAVSGTVVWLRARPDTLATRASADPLAHRPWLDGDPTAWMRAASSERDLLFAGVADLVVATDEMPALDVTAAIASEMRRIGCLG